MPVPIKLRYFGGIQGRIEAIRYMLENAKVPYEMDIVTQEGWPAIKNGKSQISPSDR